jgi:uncharacterized protein YndB with AHSA1/START domain
MTSSKDVASVERFIPAPAAPIFDLLADPSRHGEIDGSGTVRDATSGSSRVTLGSVFGMNMKMGYRYTMQNTVIEFVENERIAWQTRPANKVLGALVGGRIWRYDLQPSEGGTTVRETWDISQEQLKLMVRPLRARTLLGMAKTLQRIQDIVTK